MGQLTQKLKINNKIHMGLGCSHSSSLASADIFILLVNVNNIYIRIYGSVKPCPFPTHNPANAREVRRRSNRGRLAAGRRVTSAAAEGWLARGAVRNPVASVRRCDVTLA